MNINDYKPEDFDIQKAIEAQENYIKKNNQPYFAPNDGICWICKKNIYEPIIFENIRRIKCVTGITIEEASKNLITCCPHCKNSYCD